MQITTTQLVSGLFAIVTTAVAATWYLRGEQIEVLEEKLDTFTRIEQLGLEALSNNANKATALLNRQLVDLSKLDEFKSEVDQLSQEIEALEIEKIALERKLTAKEGEVETLKLTFANKFSKHEVFTVFENKPLKLFDADHVLNLDHAYDDAANFVFDNKNYNVFGIGEWVNFDQKDLKCRLILDSTVENKSATFSLLCK